MINLDNKYHHYLGSERKFRIDNVEENVRGYGYNCDGSQITGYYVQTDSFKLYYDLSERFIKKESLKLTTNV
tara:strand:+ start:875 stop:1090 length:216 start_codon:yes stop_codon:yes gene_type:complete